ncbi:hypothetical protein ACFLX9_00485 [Chloroflexota bacterium]
MIIDKFTRECLATRFAPSIRAVAVVEVLERLFLVCGVSKHLRSDNGPEFVAKRVCHAYKDRGARACSSVLTLPGGIATLRVLSISQGMNA